MSKAKKKINLDINKPKNKMEFFYQNHLPNFHHQNQNEFCKIDPLWVFDPQSNCTYKIFDCHSGDASEDKFAYQNNQIKLRINGEPFTENFLNKRRVANIHIYDRYKAEVCLSKTLKSLEYMFIYNVVLYSITIHEMKNVINMNYMFYNYKSLTSIKITNPYFIDTSELTSFIFLLDNR